MALAISTIFLSVKFIRKISCQTTNGGHHNDDHALSVTIIVLDDCGVVFIVFAIAGP